MEAVVARVAKEAVVARVAKKAAQSSGRAHVLLSYAQSIDGSIAPSPCEGPCTPENRLLLSGAQSMRLTMALRSAVDAVCVGVGTVLADDPRLTVREPLDGGSLAPVQPVAVVFDSSLRTPLEARLVACARTRRVVLVACSVGLEAVVRRGEGGRAEAALLKALPPQPVDVDVGCEASSIAARCEALRRLGCEVLVVPGSGSGGAEDLRLSLRAALCALPRECGLRSLMVEGGAQIITALLTDRLVHELVVTIAPVLVGGLRPLCSPIGASRAGLREPRSFALGDDVIIYGGLDTIDDDEVEAPAKKLKTGEE